LVKKNSKTLRAIKTIKAKTSSKVIIQNDLKITSKVDEKNLHEENEKLLPKGVEIISS
jgi:hypothetical protein